MIKVMLVCSAGMSTSLLVTKMNTAAVKNGIDVTIFAVAEADAKRQFDEVDVVLLGPQVRFLLPKMKELLEPKGIPVDVINGMDYGMMNGEKVLNQALELMKRGEES
ncbi:PTS system, cellobiose-specific IIB component [Proteiniborus sp. DW1]|uniref:PTS sugar transporter subunit IIB n=1 Tax=Proteiniborus sp. DW1 TaxID=1889883 RepID=UPI00092DFFCE|nr:PTS sugar transporter subunit IIB [Proteiniborus sp. DW1]SCG84262.1 PTS system, cellobiose-specific IIB component [Proteiniborus sp. DW1]